MKKIIKLTNFSKAWPLTSPLRKARSLILNSVLPAVLMMSSASLHASSYSVDMQDIDIREFAAMVSKISGNTYILDNRMSGKINIRSQKQLTDDELINLFTTEMKAKGFSLLEIGDNTWKVIPDQKARVNANPLLEGEQVSNLPFDQLVTRIVHLDHVNATQLVPVMRPLIDKKTGSLFSYPPTNSLIIIDGVGNTNHLSEMSRRLDRQGGRDIELVCLRNADAEGIAASVTKALGDASRKTGNPAASPIIVADRRTNCLLVNSNSKVLTQIRNIVTQLDNEIGHDSRVKVFYLKYAKADSVLKVLQGIAKGVKAQAEGTKPEEVSIEAHPENNALIISGPQEQIQRLGQVITQLDISRPQVHVEAIIVELGDETARELGVQWLFGSKSSPVGGTNFNSSNAPSAFRLAAAAATGEPATIASALSGTQGLLAGAGNLSKSGSGIGVLINALQADSNNNILSTPSLMVLDNEEASILVGNNIPVITGSTASDNNSNPFTTVKREDVGVKLRVTPQISDADTIRLNIFQEVSAIAPAAGAKDVVTSKREIKTTIQVNDGDTIILGGLTSEELTEVESKVPLLGDIPYLGQLFTSRDVSKNKRHLAVFLKPTVIRTPDDVRSFTGHKYSYIRARQLLRQSEDVPLLSDGRSRPLLPVNKQLQPTPEVPAPDAPASDK